MSASELHPPAPPEFDCAHCGYDLAGTPFRTCPECGRGFTEAELNACTRRIEARLLLPAQVRRTRSQSAAILAVTFCVLLALSLDVLASGVALLLTTGALGISWMLGWAAASLSRRRNLAAVQLAWTRAVLWMNAPWLLIPIALLVVLVAVRMVDVLPRRLQESFLPAMLFILIACAWFICSMTCLIRGSERFNNTCEAGGARQGPWRGAFTLLIITISITSFMVSGVLFAGGLEAMSRAGWLYW